MIFRLSHPNTLSDRSSRNTHTTSGTGRAFQDTLLGSLLSKSCLPSAPGKSFLFFTKPKLMNEQDIERTSLTIWQVIYKELCFSLSLINTYVLIS